MTVPATDGTPTAHPTAPAGAIPSAADPGTRPVPVPLSGLPSRVEIYEVGPRDGLQNEATILSVEVKAEFVRRLVSAGLRTVELTSFVRPGLVPQLADAEELLAAVGRTDGVRFPVLVPNERGLDRALASGVSEIAIFGSATESFAQRNLGRSVDESLAMFAPVVDRARAEGLQVRAYLSMCFGDPWEGRVLIAHVVAAATRLMGLGCTQLSLGDTIGVATPGHVVALIDALAEAGLGPDLLAVHFHDTYGQALANTVVALQHGVTTVDAAAGGLGGCPFAKSATGNLATEDLVWLLHGLGIDTGVDLATLARTSLWLAEQLDRPSPSRTVQALAPQLSTTERRHPSRAS
ncbi:hydroxymethylglutaryl-CoA lyase [Georgenia soli]|uniref:Hydroxymethylglutaryl-CoA lyase n=1 Tax=Georgenia soli TaxID=638953 RepID=A0A2A9EH66_9MICO|nr:hydroxymethylglutaryl-CoA lyase [Georgenia soli]PFG38248.1 hydroxymethylglutaryl-CoA lyase [Georgenia soli]